MEPSLQFSWFKKKKKKEISNCEKEIPKNDRVDPAFKGTRLKWIIMLESSIWFMQQRKFWRSSLADWKDGKRWSWRQWLPNFAPCTVHYFMWNTSTELQTLLSVEHRGVNLLAKQNPTHQTCLGTEVCFQALLLSLCLGQLCRSPQPALSCPLGCSTKHMWMLSMLDA